VALSGRGSLLPPGWSLEDAAERLGDEDALGPALLRIEPGDGTMDLDDQRLDPVRCRPFKQGGLV